LTWNAYITSVGAFLPGEPIGNDEIEVYLGSLPSGSDRLRRRMLEANGIEKRHYAIDRTGQTTILNQEMAAEAVRAALQGRGMTPKDLRMLATGTTQPDLPVPGFASMVHGRLGGRPIEILSAGGVCCSGMEALSAVTDAIRLGRHRVVAGSTWQDQPTPAGAHAEGMLNLRQDTAILNNIVALGVEEYVGLVRSGRIVPDEIDHLLVHYSSEYFRSTSSGSCPRPG
jgi:3-oxoacyl-[acyl-carrier-protein] synthase III